MRRCCIILQLCGENRTYYVNGLRCRFSELFNRGFESRTQPRKRVFCIKAEVMGSTTYVLNYNNKYLITTGLNFKSPKGKTTNVTSIRADVPLSSTSVGIMDSIGFKPCVLHRWEVTNIVDKAKTYIAQKCWEEGKITWAEQEDLAEALEFRVWWVHDQLTKGLLVRRNHSICPFQEEVLSYLKDVLMKNLVIPTARMKSLFKCNVHRSYDDDDDDDDE